MTVPVQADVDDVTRDALVGMSKGDQRVLDEMVEFRTAEQESTGLDARTFSLVKIAALVALDAPPASYLWQVANALDSGRHAEGHGRRAARRCPAGRRAAGVAAAPEIMVALGLELPDGA